MSDHCFCRNLLKKTMMHVRGKCIAEQIKRHGFGATMENIPSFIGLTASTTTTFAPDRIWGATSRGLGTTSRRQANHE